MERARRRLARGPSAGRRRVVPRLLWRRAALVLASALPLVAAPRMLRAQQDAEALVADPSRVIARRDSFVALAPTGPVGFLRAGVVRGAGGTVRYSEDVEIDDVLEAVTLVQLDSLLGPVRTQQSGTAAGAELLSDLRYGAGRVQGMAAVPAATGMRLVRVDTALAPGTADLHALGALLPAVPWREGLTGTLAVYSADAGPGTARVAVRGRETLVTPAGTLDTWVVRVEGAGTPSTYHVAAAPPWRLVKMQADGAPFAFVLAK